MTGQVFNQLADDYDRHRPTYPEALIDTALARAGLRAGDPVLEVGAGSGQLTGALVACGLHVTALEPGDNLLALARRRLAGAGLDAGVEFIAARLEDAQLPAGRFRAAFSASAIHWVDPDVGWHKLAAALVPGGTLALISYFGLENPDGDDQAALRQAMFDAAPELADGWPENRTLEQMAAGVSARADNIAAAWGWLGNYDIGRPYVSELFGPAELTAIPTIVEQTAEQLNALLATMSFWARLSRQQQEAVRTVNRTLHARLGRPLRASTAACLLTAARG